jgi:uncharacterized YigZ family protein
VKILKEERQVELVVKKSRFIAIAKTCNTPAEVKSLVDRTRAQFEGATHVVHAAVMGNQFSYSDDHEPKNTAGRPALEVLKGSGITNIIVLIVRYFGGTLLGTGGLVKAYGDSTKAVLDGIQTEELVEKSSFSMDIGYDCYESTKRILASVEAQTSKEDFGTSIFIQGTLPSVRAEELVLAMANLTNGKCKVSIDKD